MLSNQATPTPATNASRRSSVGRATPDGALPDGVALPSHDKESPHMPQSRGRVSVVSPFYMSAWARVSLGCLLLLGLWLAILWAVQP